MKKDCQEMNKLNEKEIMKSLLGNEEKACQKMKKLMKILNEKEMKKACQERKEKFVGN